MFGTAGSTRSWPSGGRPTAAAWVAYRWVVERTIRWYSSVPPARVRYDRREISDRLDPVQSSRVLDHAGGAIGTAILHRPPYDDAKTHQSR